MHSFGVHFFNNLSDLKLFIKLLSSLIFLIEFSKVPRLLDVVGKSDIGILSK